MTVNQKEEIKDKFRDKLLYVNYSKQTIAIYIHYVDLFLTWLPVELENLTPTHLTEFMTTLEKYAPHTKNNIMRSYLPAFLNFLTNIGILKVNPLTLMKIPVAKGEQKSIEILSAEEMKLMVENPSGKSSQLFRNKVLLKILSSTGIRISEALFLRPVDIKGNKLVIHGKGAKERIVDITPSTTKLLQEYLQGINVANDKPILDLTRQWAQDIVADTAKKNGINKKITPHTFRHSFATMWAKNGGNESALRKYMGWSRTFNTNIYIDLANQDCGEQYRSIVKELGE